MGAVPAWRELLGHIIQDSQERQRIANELGVNPITLSRWANNTASPRPQNIQNLLNALPQHRALLIESLSAEFPNAFLSWQDQSREEASKVIPTEFYTRALNAYVNTPKHQRFWTLSNLILQQALGQLDPNHLGLAINIVQCMPPSSEQKIRSLRERIGRATPPWQSNLEQYAIFLGSESLAGYVVASCRPIVIQNRQERGIYPAHWVEWEESAAVYPLMLAGEIAGCLSVSSTQPGYFLPFRCELIQNYAELLVLAFEPADFYPPDSIELWPMPFYKTQEKYLTGFRQRVSEVLIQALREQRPMHLAQAQQIVWQQLEEELLQLPPYTGE